VEVVGAVLGDHVHLHAHVAAVLRRICASLHLKLLHRVHRGTKRGGGDQVVHDADAVQRHAVLNLPRARADEVFAAPGVAGRRLQARQHARRRDRQLQRVAPVQRQVRGGCLVDDFTQAGVVGGNRRHAAGHYHLLLHGAYLQPEIRAHNLVGLHEDAGLADGLKPFFLRGDRVGSDFDELEVVISLGVGERRISIVCAFVDGGHGGARHGGAALIRHVAHKRGGIGQLRAQRQTQTHYERSGRDKTIHDLTKPLTC